MKSILFLEPSIPVELAEGVPGVATMDNNDFCEDILTGILQINN